MMKTNKKPWLSYISFILLVVLLDILVGQVMRYFYFKQKSGYSYRTTYSIDSTNQAGLVFGSSRANHHYDISLLRDSLQMSFYNVGRDGQSILYDYAILQATLKRYTPKMIILDYQDEEFIYFSHSYDRLSNLLPYVKSHRELLETVRLRGRFENLKMLSSTYPYNSLFFNILGGIRGGAPGNEDEKNGYLPLNVPFTPHGVDRNKFLSNRPIDTVKVNAFVDFARLCQARKIELYLVMSPYFEPVNDRYTQPIDSVISSLQVKHFDYSHFDKVKGNTSYFADEAHLNAKGADLFTRDLIVQIKAAEKK